MGTVWFPTPFNVTIKLATKVASVLLQTNLPGQKVSVPECNFIELVSALGAGMKNVHQVTLEAGTTP